MQAVARSVDELPEAAKRARLMELHIQASARPNCASVPYYPGEELPYVALIPCCSLECQAGWFEVASCAPSDIAVLRCRPHVLHTELSSAVLRAWGSQYFCITGKGVARKARLNTTR